MIEIEKKGVGGPGIFLTRLERELIRRDLDSRNNHEIILATDFVNTVKKFVLRLDGINFLKMTSVEVSNLLKYRWNGKFSRLVKFNNILRHLLVLFLEKNVSRTKKTKWDPPKPDHAVAGSFYCVFTIQSICF